MNPTPPDSRLGDSRETLSSIGVFGGWRGSDGPHKMEQKARMRLLKAEERVAATLSAYTKSRDATIALPAGEKFHQSIVTGSPKPAPYTFMRPDRDSYVSNAKEYQERTARCQSAAMRDTFDYTIKAKKPDKIKRPTTGTARTPSIMKTSATQVGNPDDLTSLIDSTIYQTGNDPKTTNSHKINLGALAEWAGPV